MSKTMARTVTSPCVRRVSSTRIASQSLSTSSAAPAANHAVDVDASGANKLKLERGPMPNVMAALRNIGGALCSTPQSLADAHY